MKDLDVLLAMVAALRLELDEAVHHRKEDVF